ncbi:hypothetical protein K7432_014037 [Basidiobolus ranarum]|uniref:Uncharacterized protein n=1 Tax=Basidiobolus ranarum TaxID=34480 RepID=A0ABR2WI82_9FUNG
MASLLFDDIDFPTELYVRETAEFSTPIRTLLQFAPHILENLPKPEDEQIPIHPKETDAHLKSPKEENGSTDKSWWSNLLNTNTSQSLAKQSFAFCLDMARLYMEQNQWRERTEANQNTFQENSKNSERKAHQKKDNPPKEEDTVDKNSVNNADYSKVATAAAGVSALTLSLYSTYKLSSTIGQITFHNQLSLLLEHVESILETTRFWMQEQVDPVPPLVKKDVERLEKLVDLFHRLDSRSERKMEATAWAAGALGSLGLLGGVAVGSVVTLGGGAVVALGGLFYGVYSKGRFSSKQYADIRGMLEGEVQEIVRQIDEKNHTRRLIDQFRQVRPKVYNMADFPKVPNHVPHSTKPIPSPVEEQKNNDKQRTKIPQASWF